MRLSTFCILAVLLLGGCGINLPFGATTTPHTGIVVQPPGEYEPDADCVNLVSVVKAQNSRSKALAERYKDLQVIDIHTHGVADDPLPVIQRQDQYNIDRAVVFGGAPASPAVDTDRVVFQFYSRSPGRIYPFFAGIPLNDTNGISLTAASLEKGFLGISVGVSAGGAASLPGNTQDLTRGILPDIYRLSARYHAPILLHVDQPSGLLLPQLEQVLDANPDTLIILGYANPTSTPQSISALVKKHTNLFISFTAYNPGGAYKTADYVSIIERYSDQFMLSSDLANEADMGKASQSIYELLDLLTPQTACKVSHQNIASIIESQPATASQVAQIRDLSLQAGEDGARKLNRRTANELIVTLENTLQK